MLYPLIISHAFILIFYLGYNTRNLYCRCSESGASVGEILCESYWENGNIQSAGPRYVARKQVDRLSQMGYKIMSAFEIECMMFEKDSLKPLTQGNDFAFALSFSRHEKMLYEFDRIMQPLGVDIETFHCEYSPGQFEFTFVPKYGIETADMMFRFKEAMKELCAQRGLHVTYMTRPFASSGCSNGTHFNHSLWDKAGKNVLYDPTKPDNLSDVARYFLGGIFKHADGLTAICCPTLNCYRRLHNPWAPGKCTWGIGDRTTLYRVKSSSEKSTYFESRLPGGSCNPYTVLAATLAAGIDGIENKIEPPPKGDYADMPSVPSTLQEALNGLAKDQVLIDALGNDFVQWFSALKHQSDLVKFGHHDIKKSDKEEIEAERKEYFEFM